jgi:hypothetical protein
MVRKRKTQRSYLALKKHTTFEHLPAHTPFKRELHVTEGIQNSVGPTMLNENEIYIKIVALDEIYNFVVLSFFI